MKCRYRIAGHRVQIVFPDDADVGYLLPSYAPFADEGEGECLFRLTVDPYFRWVAKGEEVGQFDCGGRNFGVYVLPDGAYQFEICDERNELCALLQSNADFSDCICALVAKGKAGQRYGLNNALMLVYAFAAAPHATLLMHSSVVRQGGKGYCFLGKSGTGKSTHTRLWLRHVPGSDLMNDDNPVVRVQEDGVWVYGSPWSGKTPCYLNESYPLGAVVRLEQAPANQIVSLGSVHAFAALLPSCSCLKQHEAVHRGVLDAVTRLSTTVPVYHLKCLPDADAARLCSQTVGAVDSLPN